VKREKYGIAIVIDGINMVKTRTRRNASLPGNLRLPNAYPPRQEIATPIDDAARESTTLLRKDRKTSAITPPALRLRI
jgi:hypothetical protein